MSSSIKESKSVESASPDPEKQAGVFESHDHVVDDKIETLNVLDPDAPPSALDRTSFWGRSLALSAALERKRRVASVVTGGTSGSGSGLGLGHTLGDIRPGARRVASMVAQLHPLRVRRPTWTIPVSRRVDGLWHFGLGRVYRALGAPTLGGVRIGLASRRW
ncbi:hypothetical protein B0H16DRAFT_1741620 [Mycena metata]|uniref:Uncharacterized protein n=1 Tax=Mycena metata TaxID=1033252 RepID=A0AAD7H9T8_9AGAR|nr:hypothetical protein B0H16DRAFT_1741620 [Mycena metata]